MSKSLRYMLADYFDTCFAKDADSRRAVDESELAYRLEKGGFCNTPYLDYEYALNCPLNKQRAPDCLANICPHNEFCKRLRKEGYI